MVKTLVIWAHSACRSNAALFAEVRKLAEARGIVTRICLWNERPLPSGRLGALNDTVTVGEDQSRGMSVLRANGGPDSVQVFCVYQNSPVWRRLIVEAKRGGARVVVNAEAPCEMCLGPLAALKRLYYRWILPRRVRAAVAAADLFLSASGEAGVDRLERLGWRREQIVPFGYASPRLREFAAGRVERSEGGPLWILHLGSEAPVRDVRTLERAMKVLRNRGVMAELARTAGALTESDLVAAIRRADVVVGCGLCEPWGMRINDALLEGTPVVVSDGMGACSLCATYDCGRVFRRGDARSLADALTAAADPSVLSRWRAGAARAAEELLPERRASFWLKTVLGGN